MKPFVGNNSYFIKYRINLMVPHKYGQNLLVQRSQDMICKCKDENGLCTTIRRMQK